MISPSPYDHGFARVAACTLATTLANPARNAAAILETAHACHTNGTAIAVFPELCLSGYAIDDLLLQDALLDSVATALTHLATQTADLTPLLLVGAPLPHAARLYNCAVALHRGRILGVIPKSHLPNYREFYEKRHFASGTTAPGATIAINGNPYPFGTNLLFVAQDLPGLTLHAEICEDLWVPIPPSAHAALAGATILANLSASNITIGKAETRTLLCRAQSARCLAAYLYAAAGAGESTTDTAWDGQAAIFELGETLAETNRFPREAARATADIDLDRLRQARLRQGSFDDNRPQSAPPPRLIPFRLDPPRTPSRLERHVGRFPFVPENPARLAQDCYEAYNIQISGLAQRLQTSGIAKAVIGVSGGLDSTQALLVAAQTFDRLGYARDNILAYTMPGFATSAASLAAATRLMAALGVSAHTLDIRPAATLMLRTIGHPHTDQSPVHDITFENVQAGLRTDYLFRLANLHGGLVLGTGDLSELALGWSTYGVGDHMSHYNVNAGLPKTLLQHLIRWVATTQSLAPGVAPLLHDILEAEISPELIPGATAQSTEAAIGPYELQDFTLYYLLRHGFHPRKIAYLALTAWSDAACGTWPEGFPAAKRHAYTEAEILHWMKLFLNRFFASQFKRSAQPNGPKITDGGSLSPRADWRAPSDAAAAAWLAEI